MEHGPATRDREAPSKRSKKAQRGLGRAVMANPIPFRSACAQQSTSQVAHHVGDRPPLHSSRQLLHRDRTSRRRPPSSPGQAGLIKAPPRGQPGRLSTIRRSPASTARCRDGSRCACPPPRRAVARAPRRASAVRPARDWERERLGRARHIDEVRRVDRDRGRAALQRRSTRQKRPHPVHGLASQRHPRSGCW